MFIMLTIESILFAPLTNLKIVIGTLVQVDESIMAIIKNIDNDTKNQIIIQDLDSETCLINDDKLPELQRKLKEVCWLYLLVGKPYYS